MGIFGEVFGPARRPSESSTYLAFLILSLSPWARGASLS